MNFAFGFDMQYLHWWILGAIVLLSMVVLALRALERFRMRRLDTFVASGLAPRLLPGFDGSLRRPLTWTTILGCLAIILAVAQPHWGQKWQEVHRRSRDVLVVLDTSESMRAANPLPTRMDRAKQKIATLIDRAVNDRFGLVAFSGAAELLCPLTLDHAYLKSVLTTIDTDVISKEGTDIGAALDAAVEVFKAEDETSDTNLRDTRAILLISDGEQVSGDALEAAEDAASYARIFVIGVGDPSGTEVRLPDFMRRAVGSDGTHISKLDEEMLSRIAMMGNGAYARASIDNWDIDELYGRFEILSTRPTASDIRLRLANRYQWPLLLAIVAFSAEGVWLVILPILRRWRARRTNPQKDVSYA